jgi:thymidylate synthase
VRAHFVRGEDPMDAMELGNVRGRKLKVIEEKLLAAFKGIFTDRKFYRPKFEIEYKETNVGFENRNQLETDIISIVIAYKGYNFGLQWIGNPFNSSVRQKYGVQWRQLPRGAADGDTFLDLDSAIDQLKKWIKFS